MHQAGLLEYALRKSKRTRNPCPIHSKGKGNNSNGDPILLKLKEFIGAFFILGAGFGFAIIALIGEFIAKQIIDKRR